MRFHWVWLVSLALFLSSCATGVDNPAEKYKDYSAERLFNTSVLSMEKGEFKNAIERFEALDARYPFGDYAEKAQLYIIYAYYRAGQYPEALVATDRYIHLHPDGEHIDYAYFMQGVMNYQQNLGVFERYFPSDLSQRDLKPARQSYLEFMTLVQSYPKSQYVPNAIRYMMYIRNLVAKQMVTTAAFYYDRKAYVAAANRANTVITNFEGTPSVEQALFIAIESYRSLHLDDIANTYYRVLQLNYPDSSYLKQLDRGA